MSMQTHVGSSIIAIWRSLRALPKLSAVAERVLFAKVARRSALRLLGRAVFALAGARVQQNTLLREFNLSADVADARKLEVLADTLPLRAYRNPSHPRRNFTQKTDPSLSLGCRQTIVSSSYTLAAETPTPPMPKPFWRPR